MARKVNVKVTVELLIHADDGADLDEVISQWASESCRYAETADVQTCDVLESEVLDSRSGGS